MKQEVEILDFEDEHLLDTFFDWTAMLSQRMTGLKVNIWSKWNITDKEPTIIIGKAEYWNRYIIVVTISPTPRIVAKTFNITDEQMEELQEGINYVADNYDLFLKHFYNNNNGAEFDDDDLFEALAERRCNNGNRI